MDPLQPSSPRPAPRSRPHRGWLAAGLLAVGLGACRSPEEFRQEADEQVFAIVEARRAELLGEGEPIRLLPPEDSLRQRILAGEQPPELSSLDLVDCLKIAAENSRTYQERQETLFLVALDLTLQRYRYQVQTTGTAAGFFEGTGWEDESAGGSGGVGLSRLLGTGAQILGNIGLTLFRDLTSGDPWSITSDLALSVTQPLLRGFGEEVVKEPLTQAERDVLYEVRSYERFRRSFAVSVADSVYRILQQADVLENELANYESLKLVRERNEAWAQAGRMRGIELDQARQDELNAETRVISARQALDAQLDDLKLQLGLPVELPLALDPAEFERLRERGLAPGNFDEERAIELALTHRLDYLTAVDRVEDAERAARVAADALRAGLDIGAGAQVSSRDRQPGVIDGSDIAWVLELDVDLPIDRMVERNAYRARLVVLDAARRNLEELTDQITSDLRDSLRTLLSRRQQYAIQAVSVELARRRVENTRLELEAGRSETRDLLDSQESLLNAQNLLSRALIDYELSYLAFWRDVEGLRVDEDGISIDPDIAAELPTLP